MTPLEKVINLSIEHGYEPFRTVKISELSCELLGDYFNCNFKPLENGARVRGICSANINRIFLDATFWQTLGRGLGNYGTKCYACAECKQEFEDSRTLEWLLLDNGIGKGDPCWKHIMVAFTFHIAAGKDIESFFNELLK